MAPDMCTTQRMGTARGPTIVKMMRLSGKTLSIRAERQVQGGASGVLLCEWHTSKALTARHREP